MATNITTPEVGKTGGNPLATAWRRLQAMRPGDAGTGARAQLQIMKTLGSEGAAVRASSVGGYVELRGTVPSRQVYEQAAAVAGGAFGARGVLNFLEIR